MKKLIKSIISVSLVVLLSFGSFAAVLYSPGANTLNTPNPLSEEPVNPIGNTSLNKEIIENISKIIVPSNSPKETVGLQSSNIINVAQSVNSPADKGSSTAPIFSVTNATTPNTMGDYAVASITTPLPEVSAPAYIVINATTRQIYGGKDYTTKYEPAGLTNLMTAYLGSIFKNFTDELPVTLKAAKVDKDASIAGLDKGDKITLYDAIASMFVKSCADSANVVAENVSGDIDKFIELMNTTAKTIGCNDTNFINANGLNNDAQLTTAYDMALIMDKVTSNQELVNLMSLSTYTLPATKKRDKLILFSRNTMLSKDSPNYNADVTCSRMGYTSKTGYTMASMCNYKGNRLIVVILKETGSHFENTKKLIDFAKLAYEETK